MKTLTVKSLTLSPSSDIVRARTDMMSAINLCKRTRDNPGQLGEHVSI